MMYDFKKWQYNSAEKQAVMEEAMKADAAWSNATMFSVSPPATQTSIIDERS